MGLGGLVHEVGLAVRRLRKSPGLSLTVVMTLGLGIGAATAVFSLVEGILLRPLPFKEPTRLVLVGDHLGSNTGLGVTALEIATYAKAASAFSAMGGYANTSYALTGEANAEQVNAGRFGASVFETLGVGPVLGRVFTAREEETRQPVVVLSYGLWSRRYGRDPKVLGRTIVLDRKPYVVIGVMPRGFAFPIETGRLDQTGVFVPLSLTTEELSEANAGAWTFHIVGRLKDGVTLQQGARDADRVAQEIMRNFPPTMSALHIRGDVGSLNELTVGDARPLLRSLFAAVAVVLLIACVNVAGLLLVRAIRRRREYALRLALGARQRAVVNEAVLEGLVLSLAGGLLGLGIAAVLLRVAAGILPDDLPRLDSVSIDAGVAGFATLVSLLTGVLCSLAPAFAALKTDLVGSLKDGAGSSAGSSHSWLRSALVVGEIAIALVLLTTAGEFLRSFQKMRAVDPGYRADHVVVAGFKLPLEQYGTDASADQFKRAVVERLMQKPGVVAAGISNTLPGLGNYGMSAYTIEGDAVATWKLKFAAFEIVYGDVFKALGMRVVDGRKFTQDDRADTPLVVMVNESMARHEWPGQRAVGKRIHFGNPKKQMPWATVVGVVADTKLRSRDEPSGDQWFVPAEQPKLLYGGKFTEKLIDAAGGYIAVRSLLPPEEMVTTLRSAVAEVDAKLALEDIQPMTDVLESVEAPRRFNTDLITVFAGGALLLAITGIYAVVAFSVSMRAQEIAIRMALGAQRGGIARLVLIAGARLAVVGCVLGVVGSLALSKVVGALLFDTSARDPLVYLGCVGIMVLLALVASLLPAVRAASVDPTVLLRAG